jgi:uncharacterized membrane protein
MNKLISIAFWVAIAIAGFVLGWSLKAWSLTNKKAV